MLMPSIGFCWYAVYKVGSGMPAASRMVGATSITWRNCVRRLALFLNAIGPMDDGAVARAAPVRGHLLCPLIRRVHGVRPADRIVVVARPAELIDDGIQIFGRLDRPKPLKLYLVKGAVERALGRCAVVADDVDRERVVEDAEILDGIEHPPDVIVGVFHEPGITSICARDRLQSAGIRPRREFRHGAGSVLHPAG